MTGPIFPGAADADRIAALEAERDEARAQAAVIAKALFEAKDLLDEHIPFDAFSDPKYVLVEEALSTDGTKVLAVLEAVDRWHDVNKAADIGLSVSLGDTPVSEPEVPE